MKFIEFIKSVYSIKEIPKKELPTVVLCGRSNVGKSSFINSIFAPLKIAKTSSTPGKTKSINYYIVENKFYIVDLPGFGYAKVSRTERENWKKIIEEFFIHNKNIVMVFHIMDSRHDPMEPDKQLNEFIHYNNLAYYVVLNKTDKLKQSEVSIRKRKTKEIFPEIIFGENAFLYSAVKGIGKKDIVNLLNNLLLS